MGFCRLAGTELTRVRVIGHAHVAQLAERVLGKDEVISSILIMGSI